MDFQLSADQKMIVETVRSFVSKELPIARMRKMRKDALGYGRAVVKQMGELGWLGIAMPESLGGFSGSFVDTALILEQFGTTLVTEPFLPSVVLAGNAILRAGDEAQQQRWLAPMIAGDTTLALAYAERDGRFDPAQLCTIAEASGAGWRLKGEKVWVLNGHGADHIVVAARTAEASDAQDGVSLFVIDGDQAGATRQTVTCMDGHKAAMVQLDCQLDGDRLLGAAGSAGAVLDEVLDLGAAAACAEGCGIMKTVLAMTVEYLQTREQFGVKIGSFQALQHRAVDMFIESELARSTSIMASLKVDSDDPEERMRAVSAAKAQMAFSGKYITQQSIQLHGGIGCSDEHDVGLFFKRMHTLNTLFGDEDHHVQRFASLPSWAELEN